MWSRWRFVASNTSLGASGWLGDGTRLVTPIRTEAGPSKAAPAWMFSSGLAIFAVSLAAYASLVRVLGVGGYDLTVYLMGGTAFRAGEPVYDRIVTSSFGVGYFTYPPVTLLAFGPLSLLPPGVVHGLMVALNLVVLLGVVWLALRLLGYRASRGLVGLALGIGGVALWLQPVYDTIGQGQVNLLLVAAVLTDVALDKRRRWPTGVLIGMAAAVKIVPGIFILYLLVTGRFRAAGTATATAAGLTLLGFLVARRDSVQFWLHGTFADAARVAMPLTPDSVFNQSLRGAAVRLAGAGLGTAIWVVLATAIAVIGLSLAAVAERTQGPLPGVLAAAVTGLLVAPLTWHEHWVWVVPVLVLLLDLAHRTVRHSPQVAGLLPFLLVPFLMWPLPIAPGQVGPASILSPARNLWHDKGIHNPVVGLLGTAYVTVGLILILGGAFVLSRALARRPDAGPGGRPASIHPQWSKANAAQPPRSNDSADRH
jgi:alpha-1,2-mannosyltransferase